MRAIFGLVALAASTGAQAQTILAQSRFDADAEGWRVVSSSGQDVAAAWTAAGHPGGGLLSADDPSAISYWQAPASFRGDKSAALGGVLSYDVFLVGTTNLGAQPDVVLSGGGLTLYNNHSNIPDDYFIPFNYILSVNGGWKVGSLAGPAATLADLQQVLADVTDLRLLADYRTTADSPTLDNVELTVRNTAVPSSNFDDGGIDGWKNLGDATLVIASPNGFNGTGCIQATDHNDGLLWFFAAPAKYLGDVSRFRGGTLTFHHWTTNTSTSNSTNTQVYLTSPTHQLQYNGVRPVAGVWTLTTVPLAPSAGWTRTIPTPAAPATQQDFDIVMSGLKEMVICNEFSNQADTGRLDNVAFNPGCGTSDFNGDGDFGTDADIEAFFACLGGSCCDTCYAGGADFNADGDIGTDQDIESFFRVLGGGAC